MFIQKITNGIITTSLFLCVLSLSTLVHAAELSASVTVNPVGDFTVEIRDFEAHVKVKENSYSADKFDIPWSSLSTGMALRDKHALKYVNADKYPNIEVIQALGKNGQGVAKIKFNNVEKIIKGKYTLENSTLIAEFSIILSEFNIKDISFKGAGVNDEVKVKMKVPIANKSQVTGK